MNCRNPGDVYDYLKQKKRKKFNSSLTKAETGIQMLLPSAINNMWNESDRRSQLCTLGAKAQKSKGVNEIWLKLQFPQNRALEIDIQRRTSMYNCFHIKAVSQKIKRKNLKDYFGDNT